MVSPRRCAPVVWLRNAGMYEPGHPPPGSPGNLHALPPPPRYVCARREEPGLAVQLPAPGAPIFIGSGGLQDGSGRTIDRPSGTARKIGRKSAGENFRGFIPLFRLPLRPGTGASRFFSGTQDVVRRSSIHPPIRPGATYNLCCCQHRVGARGLLQRRRPYLNTSKIWSLPVLKSRSRSACSSTSASTGSSMSTPGVWPNIFSMSTCRACM